jgi:ribose/xylose/arabinose/galactoside ABC-type transport system permease subunit
MTEGDGMTEASKASSSSTGTHARGAPSGSPATRSAISQTVRLLRNVAQRVLGHRLAGLLGAIVVTMVIFQSLNSYFLTATNMLGLLRSMSSLAIVACGVTLVLVAGELDLSVGSIYGLGAMVPATLWLDGWSLPAALAAGIAAGALAGTVNAFVTTMLNVPSFIATLGMLSLAQGITFLISNSQSVTASRSLPGYNFFTNLSNMQLPFEIPAQVLWLVLVSLVLAFLLRHTVFGFRLSAIGGNTPAAVRAALPVRAYKFWVFALSGVLATLAGVLDFSLIGSTTPTSGTSLTFPVFAAVIIGGASLLGGRGSISGTLAGAFFLTLLSNGLSLLGVGAYAQLLFTGIVTIGAVALDRWTNTRNTNREAALQF